MPFHSMVSDENSYVCVTTGSVSICTIKQSKLCEVMKRELTAKQKAHRQCAWEGLFCLTGWISFCIFFIWLLQPLTKLETKNRSFAVLLQDQKWKNTLFILEVKSLQSFAEFQYHTYCLLYTWSRMISCDSPKKHLLKTITLLFLRKKM